MTEERQIDYDALLHEALREAQRGVIRNILAKVAKDGLPGEHHFYISFNTQHPGVSIAPRLAQKYPGEMTIILQHRFWDLHVQADRFEVNLTFDGIRERLIVPFAAIRMFFDPSVHYGLQFDDGTQDGRSPSFGDAVGFPGGRGATRTGARAQGERRKTTRKPKNEQASETTPGDPPELVPAPTESSSPQGVTQGTPPAAGSTRTGPRLVETSNDSAKVVSLDQFRKK